MFTLNAFFLPRIDFRNALPCNRWVLLPGKKNFLVGDLDQKSDFYNLNYFFWSLRSMIKNLPKSKDITKWKIGLGYC